MKNTTFIFIILGLISCVKQVSLDEQHEEKLVIEGFIEIDKLADLRLTKTLSVTDSAAYPIVDDALISIKSSLDEFENFQNIGNGRYQNSLLSGKENEEYTIEINYENSNFRTTTRMPENLLQIDSINYTLAELSNDFYFLSIDVFPEKLSEERVFERIRFYKNNAMVLADIVFPNPSTQDNLFTNFNLFESSWQVGDSLKIEVLQMEEWLYDYFIELENNDVSNSVNGLLVSPPDDIFNNFEGDILGFFAAIRKDVFEIVIE